MQQKIKNVSPLRLSRELVHRCEIGDLNSVQYLLFSPELTDHADISYGNYSAFTVCSKLGHWDIVKYFLTEPRLKQFVNIETENNAALTAACSQGNLDMVKYFLSSTELTEHANFNDENYAIAEACANGHLDIVRYVFSQPGFDRYANEDAAFITSHMNNQLHIVSYLIFDYELTLTPAIKRYLNEKNLVDIESMFTVAKEEKTLNQNIAEEQQSARKRLKI